MPFSAADLLVEALADLAERDWHCALAGPLDRDPDFVGQLQARITRLGYGHRVRLTGVLTGAALSHAYTTADGTRPGQLVPPGDPAALAAALGEWLGDERHRHRLRAAARQRRSTLRGWEQTTQEIANALTAHESAPPP